MGDNPLTVVSRTAQGAVLNGFRESGGWYDSVSNWTLDASHTWPSLPPTETLEIYVSRSLATTGPLTPRMDIPRYVAELKDIPKMLRHAGDLLHKIRRRPLHSLSPDREAASATLAYQFGWAPLVEDLLKMLDLGIMVDRRNQELQKAHSNQGLKRRIFLGDQGVSGSYTPYMQLHSGTGGSKWGSKTSNQTRQTWSTVRWKVRDPLMIGKPPSLLETKLMVLGFRGGQLPITVWRLLPWSWLVDWFADVANTMQARYNMIAYKPSALNIMQTSTGEDQYTVTYQTSDWATASPGFRRVTRKVRLPLANPSPTAIMRIPYLDAFKLSILGSFTVLRLTRR